jgi:hypothetical protein
MNDFTTMISAPQLESFELREYPDHLFWISVQEDCYRDVSAQECAQLRAQGWQMLDLPQDASLLGAEAKAIREALGRVREEEYILRCAHSQLARTLRLVQQGEPTASVWIPLADWQTAQQYPVLLTGLLPKSVEATLRLADLVIGTHALIEEKHGFSLYHLDQLGEEGQGYWQELQKSLALFAAHTSGENVGAERDHVQKAIPTDLHQRASQAAKSLASCYWHLHEKTQAERLTLADIPPLFAHTPVTAVPEHIAVRGVLAAYSNAQSGAAGWQQPGGLAFTYQQGKEMAQVEFRPDASTLLSREALWGQIRGLGDLDGDVFLALLAQWCAGHEPDGSCWISSQNLLHYRGITPRKYLTVDGQERLYHHRLDDLRLMEQAIEHLRQTYVTVGQWVKESLVEGRRKRGRPRKEYLTLHSYLIQISDFLTHQLLVADAEGEKPAGTPEVQIAWKFRLGTCLETFLQDANPQLAYLLQQSLNFDPVKEYWEKRLSRFLIFNLRLREGAQSGTWCLRDIFKELSLPMEGERPDRIRARFERALSGLLWHDPDLPQDSRQLAAWSYQESLSELPAKKWLNAWLDYHICLTVDPIGVEQARATDEKEEGNRPRFRRYLDGFSALP